MRVVGAWVAGRTGSWVEEMEEVEVSAGKLDGLIVTKLLALSEVWSGGLARVNIVFSVVKLAGLPTTTPADVIPCVGKPDNFDKIEKNVKKIKSRQAIACINELAFGNFLLSNWQ